MKSIFKNSIIVAALLLGAASVSNAQVKIGTAPETIDPNSNLEVQAANGNKTIVNKATGQVTIQDGTQGLNKVLTSDANGASSWKTVTAEPSPAVLLSVRTTTAQTISANSNVTLLFTNKLFDTGNNFTLPSTFTAPSDGKYQLTYTVDGSGVPVETGRHMGYTVVGSQNYTKKLEIIGLAPGYSRLSTVGTVVALKAGDQLTVNVLGGSAFTVYAADLQILKVGI